MADTDVDLILFGIRAQLDYCVQLNIRCERRKNELQHRQNLLFKEITDALKKYESIGFGIIFTGDHDLCCRTSEGDSFPFPLPAFSIVRTCEQKKKRRLHFKPRVNDNGAISYALENDYDVILGELSWQACSPGQNDGYWFINAVRRSHESIKSCPFNFKGAEMLFAILCN
ncbi:TPA: hypothetical protein NY071_004592 [Escherichia coli]|uniref:hypothetical protein n=1 Tax=Shigella dysenteriae TaxID=622 RepID=UPI0018837D68|nr:hypothetical protein [Shigella dysenteriae]MBE9816667.1 hypothetical protein [Escherichia coli]ULK11463.1 hypothetical protein HUZ69_24130 [Shigella dysenteriae]ULK16201.1 hypothetical protein HUZ68_24125 [Shigella dysenteriae]HBE5659491.1 hypothetical protein [Escherichia coli]HCK0708217.1 hypothetical protein [Escherichia coli]